MKKEFLLHEDVEVVAFWKNGKNLGKNMLVGSVNNGCLEFGLNFFLPVYKETGLYHRVVRFFFALGIRNGQNKLERNSSGIAESWNRFTRSGLQFNKYKSRSWLRTSLSTNLLCGRDVGVRPWSMSRLQQQAGLSVRVSLMQLYWSCPRSFITTVSLEISLYCALLGEENVFQGCHEIKVISGENMLFYRLCFPFCLCSIIISCQQRYVL